MLLRACFCTELRGGTAQTAKSDEDTNQRNERRQTSSPTQTLCQSQSTQLAVGGNVRKLVIATDVAVALYPVYTMKQT